MKKFDSLKKENKKTQVVIISKKEREVLLLKAAAPRNFWQNVTGSMELVDKNNFFECAKRELYEETSINSNECEQFLDLELEFRYIGRRNDTVVEKSFLALLSEKQTIEISNEHSDYKWVPIVKISESNYQYQSNFQTFVSAKRLLEKMGILKYNFKLILPIIFVFCCFILPLKSNLLMAENSTDLMLIMVPKGVPLYSFGQNETIINEKEFYSYAKIDNTNNSYTFLVNHGGELTYETLTNSIVQIRKDLDLLPKPTYPISYPPLPKEHKLDERLYIKELITLSTSISEKKYFTNNLDQTINSFRSSSIEVSSYLIWRKPIYLGLAVKYEKATLEADYDYTWDRLKIGPTIIIRQSLQKFLQIKRFRVNFELKYLRSLYAHLKNDQYRIDINTSETELNIRMLFHYENRFGNWYLGPTYSRNTFSTKESALNRYNNEIRFSNVGVNSIGVSVGYSFKI